MKTQELRALTTEALINELLALKREQFNLRMQKTSGQMAKPHLFKQVGRKIARVKTLLTEKVKGS